MSRSKIDPNCPRHAQIARLYAEGATFRDVQRVVRCSMETIAAALAHHGVTVRRCGAPRGPRVNKDKLDQVFEAYRGGASCSSAARQVGVSPVWAWKWIKRAGLLRPAKCVDQNQPREAP